MERYSGVKRVKRKIGLVIIGLLSILAIAGCGDKKEKQIIDQSQSELLEQAADMLIGGFAQMDSDTLETFLNQSDLQINLILMQSKIPAEKEAFKSAAEAWKAAVEESGEYVSHQAYKITSERNDIIVSADIKFKNRDGEIKFMFDDSSYLKSMEVNPAYAKSEILKKAGLNTLLGMGTVFSVLIFIAFTISLLKYIPGLLENMQEKFRRQRNKTDSVTVLKEKEVQEEVEETTEDSLELIAVIMAAVAAESGMSEEDFVVCSVKRRKSNKWRAL